MREIKAPRAWNGMEMIEAASIDYEREIVIESFRRLVNEYKFDEVILMWPTGLKDREGREIYEDDLGQNGSTIYRIVWIEHRAKFGALVVKSDSVLTRGCTFPLENYFDGTEPELEWIGSIWEHPHLLKDA